MINRPFGKLLKKIGSKRGGKENGKKQGISNKIQEHCADKEIDR